MKYKKVAVGGTFDYIHDGHKSVLSKAFEIGENVLIGLVSDWMELRKDSAGISPIGKRMKSVKDYLKERGWLDRAEFEVISDPVGPAGNDEDLEAIIVSEETREGAERINKIRAENGLDSLDIIEVPLVIADDGKPISSIRIRYGEIDVHGNVIRDEEKLLDPL